MSLAWPDGHTSRLASIWSESSPAHTAFSSMLAVFTCTPRCVSSTSLATSAQADEPSHGWTAMDTVPPEPAAGGALDPDGAPDVGDVAACFLALLPQAASTRLAMRTTGSHLCVRLT